MKSPRRGSYFRLPSGPGASYLIPGKDKKFRENGLPRLPFQKCKNLAEGPTAMAVLIFFFAGNFSVGAVELLEIKNGIVSKAMRAARLLHDCSFGRIGDDSECAAILRERADAHEARAAIVALFALEFAQEFPMAVFVGRVRSGVARGKNSGSA